tara:strand:+ start:16173 stop:16862 length:690 start_codon:yes stop_codon:yes gene_type:complete
MNRPQILSIEGNIGAGKTTIIENLEKQLKDNPDVIFLREPVNIWDTIKDDNNITILQKFYENTEKYAFAFQVMAYATRSANVKNAIKKNPNCKYIICERSLEADNNIFAKMLRDDGMIEDIKYTIYEHFYHACKDDINVDAVIYIDSSPEVCLNRINKRSRDGEGGIQLDYLQRCKDYHDQWLLNNCTFPVCHINTDTDVSYDINDKNDLGNKWIQQISDYIYTVKSNA